jgi:hypothetical protein
MGQVSEAERLLNTRLKAILDEAVGGMPMSDERRARATDYAIKLAEGTKKAEWFDFVIKLHLGLGTLLPAQSVDRLYPLGSHIKGLDIGLLRRYTQELSRNSAGYSPSQRFAFQRLQGLERIALA